MRISVYSMIKLDIKIDNNNWQVCQNHPDLSFLSTDFRSRLYLTLETLEKHVTRELPTQALSNTADLEFQGLPTTHEH